MGEKMTIMHVGSGDEFSLLRQCAQRCVDNGGEWYSPVQAAAILGEHVGEPALLADAAFMGMATPECILRLLDRAEDHLTQPAQAVDVEKVREVIDGMRCVARLSDYDLLVDTLNGAADKLTAALPKDSNGAEGVA